MRFHHSTRRGRNRLSHNNQRSAVSHRLAPTSASRWSQLGYCRETNIHFNRRLPVELPAGKQPPAVSASSALLVSNVANSTNEETNKAVQRRARTNSTTNVDQLVSSSHWQQQQQINEHLLRLSLRDTENTSVRSTKTHSEEERGEPKGKVRRLKSRETSTSINRAFQAESQKIDMECARQKLVAKVEKHPFWSNKAARRMQLTNVEDRRIYIYELVSFCERRDLEWRYEPYRGGLVPTIPFKRVEPQLIAGRPSQTMSSPIGARSSDLSPRHTSMVSSTLVVPQPVGAAAAQSADSLWSCSGVGSSSYSAAASNNRSLFRRSCSAATSPLSHSPTSSTAAAATTTAQQQQQQANDTTGGSSLLYEPLSAIDRPVPSAEYIWSIEAPACLQPEPFSGYVHSAELPNSSFTKRCHGCQGRGKLKCASCYGVGYEVCISCSGKGTTKSWSSSSGSPIGGGGRIGSRNNYSSANSDNYGRNSIYANGYDQDSADNSYYADRVGGRNDHTGGGIGGGGGISSTSWVTESCHFCHGAGQKRCWVCAGKSFNHCLGCLGSGQLRCYLNLNITWLNHRDEVVLNNSDNIIPKERLNLSSGLLLADTVADRLQPLAPIEGARSGLEDLNQLHSLSKRLLDKHKETYRQERLIKQRHKVTQIECHVVSYEWKQRSGHFVIYGDERKVYIAKYPFKSLCSIT